MPAVHYPARAGAPSLGSPTARASAPRAERTYAAHLRGDVRRWQWRRHPATAAPAAHLPAGSGCSAMKCSWAWSLQQQ
ncbi:hypothetical protein G6F61_014802 [Rhizopus arrhizus]|nr:hypothetical protein G6F61_014802 [Rhizopus arrhizus]